MKTATTLRTSSRDDPKAANSRVEGATAAPTVQDLVWYHCKGSLWWPAIVSQQSLSSINTSSLPPKVQAQVLLQVLRGSSSKDTMIPVVDLLGRSLQLPVMDENKLCRNFVAEFEKKCLPPGKRDVLPPNELENYEKAVRELDGILEESATKLMDDNDDDTDLFVGDLETSLRNTSYKKSNRTMTAPFQTPPAQATVSAVTVGASTRQQAVSSTAPTPTSDNRSVGSTGARQNHTLDADDDVSVAVDDDCEASEFVGDIIDPSDSFDVAWGKLQFSGWSFRRHPTNGTTLYVQPRSQGSGIFSRTQLMYVFQLFSSVHLSFPITPFLTAYSLRVHSCFVSAYLKENYHWNGSAEAKVGTKRKQVMVDQPKTPPDARTKPQDPTKPQLSEDEMERERQIDRERDFALSKRRRKVSLPTSERPNKKRHMSSRLNRILAESTNVRKKPAPRKTLSKTQSSNKKVKKQKSKKLEYWWKEVAVPFADDVWPSFEKLGYIWDEGSGNILFPKQVLKDFPQLEKIVFGTTQGLRKFFCFCGIPGLDCSKLTEQELELLDRWVKFANVPVTYRNSVRKLADIRAPRNDDALKALLYKRKFQSTGDGKIHLPGSDESARQGKGRQYGIHYFSEADLNTKLRTYVRGMFQTPLFPTTEDGEEFLPEADEFADDAHLSLQLWAATSSEPLPSFSGLPHPCIMEALMQIPDFEYADTESSEEESEASESEGDEEEEEEEEESEEEIKSESEESEEDDESAGSSDDPIAISDDESMAPSPANKRSVAKPTPKPIIDEKYQLPHARDIWKTLQAFGFRYSSAYSHPDLEKSWTDPALMYEFLVCNGIPRFEEVRGSLDDNDVSDLIRFLSYVNVPVSVSNCVHVLPYVPELSDRQIKELLVALRFESDGIYYFAPGSDEFRNDRKVGIHKFKGLEEVRVFIRGCSSDTFRLNAEGEEVLSRSRHDKLTIAKDDMLALRVWAAKSPSPLPVYGEKNKSRRGRRAMESLVLLDSKSQKHDMAREMEITEGEVRAKPNSMTDDASPEGADKSHPHSMVLPSTIVNAAGPKASKEALNEEATSRSKPIEKPATKKGLLNQVLSKIVTSKVNFDSSPSTTASGDSYPEDHKGMKPTIPTGLNEEFEDASESKAKSKDIPTEHESEDEEAQPRPNDSSMMHAEHDMLTQAFEPDEEEDDDVCEHESGGIQMGDNVRPPSPGGASVGSLNPDVLRQMEGCESPETDDASEYLLTQC